MTVNHGLYCSRRQALRLAITAMTSSALLSRSSFASQGLYGRPKPSDVILSARVPSAEGLFLAKLAGATRCDWTYVDGGTFFFDLRQSGIPGAGGAINMIPQDSPTVATYRTGRTNDRNGRLLEAPWQRGKGLYWGCVNNPDFLRLQLERARNTLAAGAEWIQHDDAAGQIQAVSFGACWCNFCRRKASVRGFDLKRAMLQFQTESTIDYVKALRAGVNAAAGRVVVMSCNNFNMSLSPPTSLFDYGMCEIGSDEADLDRLQQKFRQFERDSWMQVVTLRSRDIRLNRATIAAVHALGGAMIFPYNVYMTDGPRYSADPELVVPLYRFVRLIGPLLDASRFTDLKAADLFSTESLTSLDNAGVKTVVRRAGTRTLVHFIPGYPISKSRPLTVRLATPARAVLQSAERTEPSVSQTGSFLVAPWDWSVVTLA
ncbi:MAG: hypothetical protein K2Q27_01585 [Novosphingobium sp.]|nr:hypothetical protein [Novosphingobium sp.]